MNQIKSQTEYEQVSSRGDGLQPVTAGLSHPNLPNCANISNSANHANNHASSLIFLIPLIFFFAVPSFASASLTDGLVGWWTFDGKDTNWSKNQTYDRSGNSNTGTMTNMSTTSSSVAGKIGQGFNFDGVNDYVNVPDNATLQPNGSSWTISFWTNAPNESAGRTFILKRQAAGSFEQYAVSQASNCTNGTSGKQICLTYVETFGSVQYVAKTTSDVIDGKWHFITAVANSNDTYNIYVDGNNMPLTVELDTGGYPTVNNTDSLRIGNNNGTFYAKGIIDDVRVYNRALSQDEITRLYNMGK